MSQDQCVWGNIDELWNVTGRLWNDVCPIIVVITGGGKSSPEEALKEFEKLDKKRKRKVIRVLLRYKGQDFSQQRTVRDDIKVTAKDMEFLIERYNSWKSTKDAKVTVSDITIGD